jgi:hypothetical protein
MSWDVNGLELIIGVVVAILGTGGFWSFLQSKLEKKTSRVKMLLGLGNDRIVFLCLKYIHRGFITKDEYESLHDYLYVPYKELGGNGVAATLMQRVSTLPISQSIEYNTNPTKGP